MFNICKRVVFWPVFLYMLKGLLGCLPVLLIHPQVLGVFNAQLRIVSPVPPPMNLAVHQFFPNNCDIA